MATPTSTIPIQGFTQHFLWSRHNPSCPWYFKCYQVGRWVTCPTWKISLNQLQEPSAAWSPLKTRRFQATWHMARVTHPSEKCCASKIRRRLSVSLFLLSWWQERHRVLFVKGVKRLCLWGHSVCLGSRRGSGGGLHLLPRLTHPGLWYGRRMITICCWGACPSCDPLMLNKLRGKSNMEKGRPETLKEF